MLKEDYQKSSKILTTFLLPNPVSLYGNYYEKKMLGTSYKFLFKLPNIRSFLSLVIEHLVVFNVLIRRGFQVILIITIGN